MTFLALSKHICRLFLVRVSKSYCTSVHRHVNNIFVSLLQGVVVDVCPERPGPDVLGVDFFRLDVLDAAAFELRVLLSLNALEHFGLGAFFPCGIPFTLLRSEDPLLEFCIKRYPLPTLLP